MTTGVFVGMKDDDLLWVIPTNGLRTYPLFIAHGLCIAFYVGVSFRNSSSFSTSAGNRTVRLGHMSMAAMTMQVVCPL